MKSEALAKQQKKRPRARDSVAEEEEEFGEDTGKSGCGSNFHDSSTYSAK
jgi:hypothetical protein